MNGWVGSIEQGWREFAANAGCAAGAHAVPAADRARAHEAGLRLRARLAVELASATGAAKRDVYTSVSHTAGWVVAIGARTDRDTARLLGVGVDLEADARVPRAGVRERVLRSGCERQVCAGLSDLAVWTIKEAAFKADPRSRGRVLPDYEIARRAEAPGEWEVTGPDPETTILVREQRAPGFVVALAICRARDPRPEGLPA